METRSLKLERVEIRAAPENSKSPGTMLGVAVPYDTRTTICDCYEERFMPGAFAKDQPENQFSFWNHNRDALLGTTAGKTLRFKDGKEGYLFEVDLPDTEDGRKVAVLAARGDVQGASIGFRANEETWDFSDDPKKLDVRTITSAKVYEVSLTYNPAYPDASAALRHADIEESRTLYKAVKEKREAELAARERRNVLLSLLSRSDS